MQEGSATFSEKKKIKKKKKVKRETKTDKYGNILFKKYVKGVQA